jgi:hypothetical protein
MQTALSTRSIQEVDNELSQLHWLMEKVPTRTAFGNSNTYALMTQIRVVRERMTVDEVGEEYDDDVTDQYILSAALDAAQWLYQEEPAPSEGWSSMIGQGAEGQRVN